MKKPRKPRIPNDNQVAYDFAVLRVVPHVHTGARQRVGLVGWVVDRVAGELRAADVLMRIKNANSFHLSRVRLSRVRSTVGQRGKGEGEP